MAGIVRALRPGGGYDALVASAETLPLAPLDGPEGEAAVATVPDEKAVDGAEGPVVEVPCDADPEDADPEDADPEGGLLEGQQGTGVARDSANVCALLFSRQGLAEVKELASLAWPVVLTVLLQFLLTVFTILFVGRIGNQAALDATVAVLFTNVTGISVGNGLATAVDTLCSQAFGAKNYKRMNVAFMKGCLVMALACIPLWALWINTGLLLRLAHQDAEVSEMAGDFSRAMIPKLPADFFYILLQRYLQAQRIVRPIILVELGAVIVHVIALYVFIFPANLGYLGAAWAGILSSYALAIAMLVYAARSPAVRATWTGFSRAALADWGEYLRLGLPGMLMVCLEWWAFEIVQLMAGSLGRAELGAQAIMTQVGNTLFMVPLGIGIASSIAVGNRLGANNATGARRASVAAYAIAWTWVCISASLVLGLRAYIPRIFTSDPTIVAVAAGAFPVVALFQGFDATQAVSSGIMRGSGQQRVGAAVNLFCFYGVAVPAAGLMAFKAHLSVRGLWGGVCCGLGVQAAILFTIVVRTNWEARAQMASDHAKQEVVEMAARNSGEDVGTVEVEVADGGADAMGEAPALPRRPSLLVRRLSTLSMAVDTKSRTVRGILLFLAITLPALVASIIVHIKLGR